MPSSRRRVAQRLDIFHRMAERDDLGRRQRRLLARQQVEFLRFQRLLDRAQPLRPLGMAHRVEMVETGRMGEEESGHWIYLAC